MKNVTEYREVEALGRAVSVIAAYQTALRLGRVPANVVDDAVGYDEWLRGVFHVGRPFSFLRDMPMGAYVGEVNLLCKRMNLLHRAGRFSVDVSGFDAYLDGVMERDGLEFGERERGSVRFRPMRDGRLDVALEYRWVGSPVRAQVVFYLRQMTCREVRWFVVSRDAERRRVYRRVGNIRAFAPYAGLV